MLGILLLNFGGPATLDDVRPYLYNLFSDPVIIQLPKPVGFLQKPLAWFISTRRAPKSRGYYEKIGGGSPLRKTTEAQARALQERLAERGVEAKAYVGMRSWNPYIEEAVDAILRDGVTDLVVVPLFPQFSVTSTGTSTKETHRAFRARGGARGVRRRYVTHYETHPGYVDAIANHILEAVAEFPDPEHVHLLFSAHSIPEKYVRDGDPYRDHTEASVRAVLERLGRSFEHTLAYQSRVGPVKWLGPPTDLIIPELGRRGVEQVLTIPISFVSEHSETLYEIDILYKELATASGIKEFRKTRALDTDPIFIDALADLVIAKTAPAARPV